MLDAVLHDRLIRTFGLFDDLIRDLDDAALSSKLPGIPSNSIGQQLWCVVGARESYARAMEAGQWVGFGCSLGSVEKPEVMQGLERSAEAVLQSAEGCDLDESRLGLMLDLLEHESSHQGQLIRYLYGLRLRIPASWKTRYALS